MLYDAKGQPIPDTAQGAPVTGRFVMWEPSDRSERDESRALTPAKVDTIMTAANRGEIESQAKLAAEIEEKNWDIFQAVQTRRLAVAGLDWEILPPEGDESTAAKNNAADVEEMLRSPQWDNDEFDTFEEALFFELQGALLPGFAVCELLWGKGGRELVGFQSIEQRHFTFVDSRRPLLVTQNEPRGIALEGGKFVTHRYRARSGDATRGGLIRPLAWLHSFENTNMKDLLTFIERYGMPFLITKVSQEAWKSDRNLLKAIVRNFGPEGGAVLSEAVQTELLQAANSTGDIYFRLLEYVERAITKVVLGQTATSSDGGGWSNDGAQSAVRQDLLEADCSALEYTARAQIIRNWIVWNKGPESPIPRLHLMCEEPEDTKAVAETAATLYTAGLEWDEEEASERFGMKLTRRAAESAQPVPAKSATSTDAAALSAEPPMDAADDTAAVALAQFLRGKGMREWFGPLQAAIDAACDEPDPGKFREKVLALTADLPGLMESLDSSAFEALLEKVIYTSVAEGKADRAAELAGKEGK